MKKAVIKQLIEHLDKLGTPDHPAMSSDFPTVLTTEEVANILGFDDGYAFTVLNHWAEINDKLKAMSQWELFQPFVNGKWVFWNKEAMNEALERVQLNREELENLTGALEANSANRVKKSTWAHNAIGNHEHLWVITAEQKKEEHSRVNLQSVLLIHQTLSAYTLTNGVVPLRYDQLRSMTNLSVRQIGHAVKILEKAGLWTVVRGFKGKGRGGTRFVSLSHSESFFLATMLLSRERVEAGSK